MTAYLEQWLKNNRIKAFYTSIANEDLRAGSQSFLQTSGLGKLKPNVLMIGFKENWSKLPRDNVKDIDQYVGILRDAFEANFGVMILRNETGKFDHSDELLELKEHDLNILKRNKHSTDDVTDKEMIDTLMSIRRNSGSGKEHSHLHIYPHIYSKKKSKFL